MHRQVRGQQCSGLRVPPEGRVGASRGAGRVPAGLCALQGGGYWGFSGYTRARQAVFPPSSPRIPRERATTRASPLYSCYCHACLPATAMLSVIMLLPACCTYPECPPGQRGQ